MSKENKRTNSVLTNTCKRHWRPSRDYIGWWWRTYWFN